jgi:hypothetical protein
MHLQRLLPANFALLAVLASLILGLGQRSFVLPLFGLVAAIGAWYWTDVRGRIRIGGAAANLAALIAAGITALDFSNAEPGQQLLSVANLLMYLQIIVLWQEKTVRIYWQLMSLSLLQVVVSAALADSVLFGVLLAVYFVFATSALTLLFLWRESLQFADRVLSPDAVLGPIQDGRGVFQDGRGSPDPARIRRGQETRAERATRAERGTRRGGWWSTPGWTRGDCVGLASAGLLHRLVVRLVLATAVAAMVLGALLFLLIPRSGRGARGWVHEHFATSARTGFNDEVQLGGLSHRILQDDQIVMRMAFREQATGRALRPGGDIWLRGGVSIDYDNGKWRSSTWDEPAGDLPPDVPHVVLQELTMEPLDVNRLFCVYPVFRVPGDSRIRFRPALSRNDAKSRAAEQYVLATTGLGRREQFQITPNQRHVDLANRDKNWAKLWSAGPANAQLRAYADNALAELAGGDAPPYDQARALESHLRDSGLFQYSLSRPTSMTSVNLKTESSDGGASDPTLDFLTSNRSGHCEYFASALTLLLRSRGIPARMVLGYKSNEWNGVGGYLQVRQLHAHAWVEAYLTRDQIPGDLIAGASHEDFIHGGWLRLDPTPAGADVALVADSVGIWAAAKALFDHVDMLWRNSVLGFNRQRQHRWLYEPLLAGLADWGFRLPNSQADPWSVWSIVITSFFAYGAILGIAFALVVVILPVGPLMQSWIAGRRDRPMKPARSPVDFYRRLEALFARRGFRRPIGQTPSEWAAAVERSWPSDEDRRIGSAAVGVLIAAYYDVRYGGRTLSPDRQQALEQALCVVHARLPSHSARLSLS